MPHSKERKEHEVHVIEFRTHLPRRNLCRIAINHFRIELNLPLCVPVVNSSMEPMSVGIHMMLFKISELIEWMMLQVMCLYKVKSINARVSY